jgi:hypothetical protein
VGYDSQIRCGQFAYLKQEFRQLFYDFMKNSLIFKDLLGLSYWWGTCGQSGCGWGRVVYNVRVVGDSGILVK